MQRVMTQYHDLANTRSISCSGPGHRPSEAPSMLSSHTRSEKPTMPADSLHAVLGMDWE